MIAKTRLQIPNSDAEPTLHDVMGILVRMDASIDIRFDMVDERLGNLERNQTSLSLAVSQIQDDLKILVTDTSDDERILRDHERRISALEDAKA